MGTTPPRMMYPTNAAGRGKMFQQQEGMRVPDRPPVAAEFQSGGRVRTRTRCLSVLPWAPGGPARAGVLTRSPSATPPSPPPGPSQSFTIDFAVPAEEDSASFLEDIGRLHEAAMEELMPLPGDGNGGDASTAGPVGPGPGSSFGSPSGGASLAAGSAPSRSLHALGLQPQFNLRSAQTLLDLFRDMLPHCPLLAVSSIRCSSPSYPLFQLD